ncbi:MAG: hypothetical protein GF317_15915 [Candidatus Lokiarchaeota archaeon]|nr:hypothetical protein [Candidatus Lokiarchaeota archaeon]MBD3201034.1 hypothetical protein [Candidatus Lokiarchaeota archaeon]
MRNIKIIGLGEVVVDWVAELPFFPGPDEKIDAISENYFSGGVTANFLVAISRLNVSCGFIGAVGKDPYGDFLIEEFKKERVDVRFTKKKAKAKTPVNFIFIVEGEKTIIQSPHMQTTKLEVSDLNLNYIASSNLLHTSIIHQELTEKAIQIAKSNNVKISIDLEAQIARRGWDALKEILLSADVVIPNKEGAKIITNTKNPQEAANTLINQGIPIVIITMGKKGVLITTEECQKVIPAYDVEKIVDTTGAGDTFNGAFSVGYWIKEWSLEDSCKFANAAAALKIQSLGARSGMPTIDMIQKFMNERKI